MLKTGIVGMGVIGHRVAEAIQRGIPGVALGQTVEHRRILEPEPAPHCRRLAPARSRHEQEPHTTVNGKHAETVLEADDRVEAALADQEVAKGRRPVIARQPLRDDQADPSAGTC